MRLEKSLSSIQVGRTLGDPSNLRKGVESRPALSLRDKVMPRQLEPGKEAERRVGSGLTRSGARLDNAKSRNGGRGVSRESEVPWDQNGKGRKEVLKPPVKRRMSEGDVMGRLR